MEPVLTHPSDHYRRSARHLRSRLDGNPGELYRSLRELSEDYDRRYSFVNDSIFVRPPTPADDFAAQIARKIRDGVLMYSDRLELLKAAKQIGIGRFEANLIIAAVQHRLEAGEIPEVPLPKRSVLPTLELVAAFVGVQMLVLFLGWVAFIH